MLVNILSPTFVLNFVALAWKMSPIMPKEAGSLNGPLCAYLIRQNLYNQTHLRSLDNECSCHISKWTVKIYGRESTNGDFPCAKLKNIKNKLAKNIVLAIMKKPKTYYCLYNLLWLTCLALPLYHIWRLAWRENLRMPKEAGLLNGPLCTYLMRQNLHDRTHLRS